jgi:hypothetical protein
MSKSEEKREKREFFSETDSKMLIECIKKRSKILENKKTNDITPGMKADVSESTINFQE